MVHPSPKHEATAFRPIVDDEHLVRRKLHTVASLVIKALGPRSVAHAYRDIIFSGRQHETLVDARRTVARNSRGRQARAVDIATVDVELDIDRAASPRTILYPAHIRRQLCDLLRTEPAALSPAISAVNECQHHHGRPFRDLPVCRAIG